MYEPGAFFKAEVPVVLALSHSVTSPTTAAHCTLRLLISGKNNAINTLYHNQSNWKTSKIKWHACNIETFTFPSF
jgi:hypothetical protein